MNRKRQRRSYSCGPCKLLKIKCDLQTPCASCIKFKREDKCKAEPPQPPSEEELRIIQERKNRMSKRKTSEYHSPSSRQQTPVGLGSMHSSPEYNGSKGFSTLPSGFLPAIPYIPMMQVATNHSSTQSLSSSNPSEDEKIELTKIQEYFYSKGLPFTQENPQNTLFAHVDKNGVSVFAKDIAEETEAAVIISKEHVNQLKAIYPNNTIVLKCYQNYFKCFNEDLLELVDYNYIILMGLELPKIFRQAEYNENLSMNLLQYRVLTLNLIVLAIGLFQLPNEPIVSNYTNQQLSKMYVRLSKAFKDQFKRVDSLLRIIHLIVWYFTIGLYYEYENNYEDNHFEYNSLLSNLLFNKEYMETIMNKKHDVKNFQEIEEAKFPHFKLILKYWLRIRTIELDMLYFQYNSSLLQSNLRFKDSVMPNREILSIIYNDDAQDLRGIRDEIQRYIFRLAENYFSQFHNNVGKDFKGLVRAYLLIYSKNYNVFKFSIPQEDLQNYGNIVTKKELILYVQNQILNTAGVKWLGFVKIETNYFPSLRYAIYITSILTATNHYVFLDDAIRRNSNGTNTLLKTIVDNLSYYHIKYIIHSLMINQFFLLCLKNVLNPNLKNLYVLDLNELHRKVDFKFHIMFNRFTKDFDELIIRNLPSFNQSVGLLRQLNDIYHHKLEFDANLSVNDFALLFCGNLNVSDYNLLLNNYFGGKSTMFAYVGKLYDLFKFIKSTSEHQQVKLTSTIDFNSQLIFKYENKFSGFEISDADVDDYIRAVVEPSLVMKKVGN